MLDNTRLRAELTHIHWTLSGVAATPQGRGLVDELRRDVGGTTAALLRQALFADCLRVAHCAVAADGQIGDEEVDALFELVYSIARHYATVLPDVYGEYEMVVDHESTRSFLARYANDSGAFGRGAEVHWPALTLCRRANELGHTEPLERYERMMTWFIGAMCEIGGVTETDPRWRSRVGELAELRRNLADAADVPPPSIDPRVQAFLRASPVFAAVQQPSSVYDPDPFDVEEIHVEARDAFAQLVERATTPSQHDNRSRMLLVLGESGCGKTHLLRGFRAHVHEYGRGYVAYAQLHTRSEDYARYLLQHVVDSLSRPYAGPNGDRTGLHELASGLPRFAGEPLKSRVQLIVDGAWDDFASLSDYVNELVDGLLAHRELSTFDPDLLRVLLYALYPSSNTTSRVYKYLRCENMHEHDLAWLGGVKPRIAKDDPERLIRELGQLAFVTQQATLVLMIDQAELAGYDTGEAHKSFQRAVNALYGIISPVPSMVAVIACLTDLWEQVKNQLTGFVMDRLTRNPPIQRLKISRTSAEIEAIVGRRLSWLYAEAGVAHRAESPVYPIPEHLLHQFDNRRARDVLDWCQQFQTRCALAGEIVDEGDEEVAVREEPKDTDLAKIAAAWNDEMHASAITVPDSEEEILALLGAAARSCAEEAGLTLTIPPRKNGVLHLQLGGGAQRADLAIGITNSAPQGGGFTGQIELLRRKARTAIPVAVRTLEFPRGPASDKALAQLLKAGGRRAYIDASTLRALVAFQRFQPPYHEARVMAWRRRDRPISGLQAMNEIFDLDRLRTVQPVEPARTSSPAMQTVQASSAGTPTPQDEMVVLKHVVNPAEPVQSRVRSSSPQIPLASQLSELVVHSEIVAAAPIVSAPRAEGNASPGQLPSSSSPPLFRVGAATGFRDEAREIEISSLLRHTGILGSSGSGKTTLALNLIEQALERDVAVVLVDRKGDLAGYAKPDWWQNTSDPERARRLAERLDVRLFTPGTRGGRPLSMSVVPDLDQVPEHDRDRMVQYAAQALAAMMRMGDAANDTARRAILTQAIAVLASRKARGGLPQLISMLEERDDELVARAGRYDDKLFRRLVQDLETVRLSDAELLDPSVEPLTAETLIGRKQNGKVPLAIACTRFLGEVERVQSWVAHLIACLNRHVVKTPRTELQTLFMIDEADLFMPAGAEKPPSKEPLQDLLKRARAAGLGIVLASQSPADFDYRSREQINTWFLGRIADKRSIDKMKPLFEHRPTVRGKLANLEAGRFVLLQDGNVLDLERTPSLLRTEQLAEVELLSLAARGAPTAAPSRPRGRSRS